MYGGDSMGLNPIELRKANKQRLFELIKNHEGEELKKVLAIFSLQTGLRIRTIEEMARELQEAGLFEVKNGIIEVRK